MNKTLSIFLALVSLPYGLVAGTPVVSNVHGGRVLGSKAATQVEVWYDLVNSSNVRVSLQISDDGGSTWNVPVLTPSGFGWGNNVAPGKDRYILWKAGTDWPEHNAEVRFRVTATDDPPVPTGFALIPSGSFQMGDAMDGISDAPVHTVNVSAFYMEKMLVTKEQWDAVLAWGLNNGYTDLDVGQGKAVNHPVQGIANGITWYAAVKWCNARSEKEGLTPCYTVNGTTYKTGSSAPVLNIKANGYRLPTEAEWEKSARGGLSGKRFPWGDTITHSQANYYSSNSYSYDVSSTRGHHPTYNDGIGFYTSPVGSFATNGYGLYDMAGNVMEWCWDWYGVYTSGVLSDPTGPSSGSSRVGRGGSWTFTADRCRVANRFSYFPSCGPTIYLGFRCARSLVP